MAMTIGNTSKHIRFSKHDAPRVEYPENKDSHLPSRLHPTKHKWKWWVDCCMATGTNRCNSPSDSSCYITHCNGLCHTNVDCRWSCLLTTVQSKHCQFTSAGIKKVQDGLSVQSLRNIQAMFKATTTSAQCLAQWQLPLQTCCHMANAFLDQHASSSAQL